MMKMVNVKRSVMSMVAASAAVFAVSCATAQPATIKDGVYTAEQAAAGKELYERRCGACHNVDFYRNTFTNRNNQPLQYLFEEIIVNMPADMPGSMMDNEYENVLAHIMSLLGYAAGDQELSYASGTMSDVVIVPPGQ
jgi:S-disulfanyl-L-cysteine oxidoreductase SoxD